MSAGAVHSRIKKAIILANPVPRAPTLVTPPLSLLAHLAKRARFRVPSTALSATSARQVHIRTTPALLSVSTAKREDILLWKEVIPVVPVWQVPTLISLELRYVNCVILVRLRVLAGKRNA